MDSKKENIIEHSIITAKGSPQKIVELGFGSNFPWKLLEKREFDYRCQAEQLPGITVNKSMIVLSVKSEDLEKFDFGDWIYSVNYIRLKSRPHYYSIIREQLKKKISYELHFEVYRTIKTQPIENVHQSSLIPPAIEIQNGYQYLLAYLTLYPGSSLGISIKAYNYKVYVVSTDNGFKSLGVRTFVIGDAILVVEGQPETTCAGVSSAIKQALTKKRYVSMVVERPQSMVAAFLVQQAIQSEKQLVIDPKLPEDVLTICDAEIKRMTTVQDVAPKSIYVVRKAISPSKKKQVEISFKSEELSIGMDPVNPILLQKVERDLNDPQQQQLLQLQMQMQQQQQQLQLQQQQAESSKWSLRRTSAGLRVGLKKIGSTIKSIKKK